MLIKSTLTWIITLLITQILSQVDQNRENWLKELLRYVTKKSMLRQVIFMLDDDQRFKNLKIDIIVREIQRCTPAKSITFSKSINGSQINLIPLPSINYPRAATIFMLFLDSSNSSYESRLLRPIKFFTDISGVNSRPKILVIHLTERNNFAYRKLFRNLWSKKFLDVTVLQIVQENVPKGNIQSKILESNSKIAFLFHFNPFTGIYDKQIFSARSQLFPNKLHDLNQHGISIGLVNDPPFANIERNLSGHPIKITGPNLKIISALSKKMNFKVIFAPSTDDETGLGDCKKAEYSGLKRKLINNELEFFGNYVYFFIHCSSPVFATTRFLDTDDYVAIVPRVLDDTLKVTLPMKTFYTLVVTIIAINVTWAILSFMKFDNRVWNPLSMFQSLLGFCVHNEPQKLVERIVFGNILLTQIIFASYLYTSLTDVSLSSEMEINNIEDLEKSNLTPMIHELVAAIFKNNVEGYMNHIRSKYLLFPGDGRIKECIEYLAKFGNVTCITKGLVAKSLVEEYEKSQNVATMKILTEPLWQNWRMLVLEPNSPYIERFDEVLLELMENGLINQWNKNFTVKQKNSWLQEYVKSTRLSSKIFVFPAFGFLLACIAFIAEVLFAVPKQKKWYKVCNWFWE